MDQTATQLASLRLAPVQCVSLGHPTTSGYPTIDYYLSSDRMEPVDGAQHYTEQLVRLPNLSIYYEPREVRSPTMNRQEIGLRSDACVYWCGQSWFKYLPQYDHVFAAIAKEVTGSQFLFIRPRLVGPEPLAKFEKRIERSFAGHGLKAHDHCVFIDAMEPHRFDAIFGLSDIFLDSIGWSGNNTTMESLVHNLPIVTMTAPLMRGRHTLAIVQQMGVHELIADTVEQYVNTAVRLALDTRWRTNIKARIAERKHNVYRDQSTVRALEGFLERVVRGAGLS
jgi:protein O-GlcNAc transferase